MGAIAQGLSSNSSPTENAHLAGPVPAVSASGRLTCALQELVAMLAKRSSPPSAARRSGGFSVTYAFSSCDLRTPATIVFQRGSVRFMSYVLIHAWWLHFWPANRSSPATLPPYRRSLAAEKSNVHFAPAVQTHAAASSTRRISLAFDLYANEIAAEMATVFFTVELIDDKHESTLRHQEV